MWDAIHGILRRKAAQGVLVRVLYDDMGSFLTLPRDYARRLAAEGIDCRVFNPFRPVLSSIQNNRDHRKIVSIDGRTAFTGGFNLADEYINAIEKHGHWKDAGICLRGDAAWGLTLMFLQMWGLASRAGDELAAFAPGPRPGGRRGLRPALRRQPARQGEHRRACLYADHQPGQALRLHHHPLPDRGR